MADTQWGLLTLAALTQNWQAAQDAGIHAEWFEPDALHQVFAAGETFWKTYHQSPSWDVLCETFPDLPPDPPETGEPLLYYRDRLWQRWIRETKLLDLPTYEDWDHPEQALEKIKQFIEDVHPPAPIEGTGMVTTSLVRAGAYADNSGKMILSSGDQAVDEVLGGWMRDDYIVSAAPYHTGKTWISLALALAFWRKHRLPVVFFNLEIAPEEFDARWDTLQGHFDYSTLIRGVGEHADVSEFAQALLQYSTQLQTEYAERERDFFVVHNRDLPGPLTPDLAYRIALQYSPGLVVIDQLSWMQAEGRTANLREQYVQVSRGVRFLATKLRIPVILNAQIGESGKIQESRNLYQDATVVVEWQDRGLNLLGGKIVKSHVVNVHDQPLEVVAHLDVGHELGVWFGSQVAETDVEE